VTLMRSSSRIIPLIAALLVLHAVFDAMFAKKLGLLPAGLGFGASEIVLGCGLMLGYRWARWLMLGACFLAIVGAVVVPVLMFLLFAEPGSGSLERWRNVTCVVAVLSGVIAWFGLAYLRSARGRQDFSGFDASVDLPPEPSWVVLPPAAVCLLLLVVTFDAGRRVSLFVADNEGAAQSTPAVPFRSDEPVEYPDPDPVPRRKPAAHPPPEAPIHDGTMDIALTDICFKGPMVRVKYTNLGTVPIPGAQFGIQVYVDRAMVHLTKDFRLDVPPTGVSVWTPEFDVTNAGYGESNDFYVVAQTYSRNVGQTNWDNDRLTRNAFFDSDRHSCPDM
jgi:hypothetical protein